VNAPTVVVKEEVASVMEQRGVSSTEYHIVGPLPAVFKVIEQLFRRYHPLGYGTYVHSISMPDSGPDFKARVSRSNSCD